MKNGKAYHLVKAKQPSNIKKRALELLELIGWNSTEEDDDYDKDY